MSSLLPLDQRPIAVSLAIENLKIARYHLTRAGATQTLAKVRSALKSAEGAHRNATNRRLR
jgi:hypothetical protein